jgi:hypothetical protein
MKAQAQKSAGFETALPADGNRWPFPNGDFGTPVAPGSLAPGYATLGTCERGLATYAFRSVSPHEPFHGRDQTFGEHSVTDENRNFRVRQDFRRDTAEHDRRNPGPPV